MKKHTTSSISAALRDLDPAPDSVLTEAERQQADATFARIVATPGDAPVPVEPDRPARSRRRRLLLAAGAAGAVGAVAVPALLLGGTNAYASWSPTPRALTGATASAAANTCRVALGAPAQEGRVTVAERRGGWVYVLLVGPRSEAVCLMPSDSVGKSSRPEGGFFGSYSPDAPVPAPPRLAPDRIVQSTSAEGSTDEGWFNSVEGFVGSGVTALTVHTSSGLDIEASVVGNRFAAWWPGTVQSSDNPSGETWSYTVHLADGSTRRTDCNGSTEPC